MGWISSYDADVMSYLEDEFFHLLSCHRPAMYLLEGEGAPFFYFRYSWGILIGASSVKTTLSNVTMRP